MKKTGMRQCRADNVFDAVNLIICIILLLVFLYPLYFVVIASFSEPSAVWNGDVLLWPVGFCLDGYKKIMTYSDIITGYINSICYTAGSVALGLVLTISAAYPLAQSDFYAGKFFSKFLLFTMFFSGGLIPTYFVVKGLGLLNTPLACIIPGAASVTNIIITRTYIKTSIPGELREAAFLDGCTHFTYLFRIALPLSKAILAVMALYYGVGQWNAYFNAMIYLTNAKLYPLQLVLRGILLTTEATLESGSDPETLMAQQRLGEVIKYGVIVVSALPAMIAYPFVQKNFVKGVMIGSLKG
ncbi:MAG: carbohydrate ABC transporter permease [Eubacteriales bacterium]|nr:carbohydrate ABC transporter permease [Eubacteriales bacterium]